MSRKGLRTHNRKHSDMLFGVVHRLFGYWLRGMSYAQIAERMTPLYGRITPERAAEIVRKCVRELWVARYKWRLAEAACHALSMELRMLRLGKEAEPDRPIETIDPPVFWLRAFNLAGIHTVNQLRSVPTAVLLSREMFPKGAIDWAVMKLDKLGLSHVLVRPKAKVQFRRKNPGGKPEVIR